MSSWTQLSRCFRTHDGLCHGPATGDSFGPKPPFSRVLFSHLKNIAFLRIYDLKLVLQVVVFWVFFTNSGMISQFFPRPTTAVYMLMFTFSYPAYTLIDFKDSYKRNSLGLDGLASATMKQDNDTVLKSARYQSDISVLSGLSFPSIWTGVVPTM